MNIKLSVLLALVITTALTLVACTQPYVDDAATDQASTKKTSTKKKADGGADDDTTGDVCGAVTTTGHCTSASAFQACTQPEGGKRKLTTTTCRSFETCSEVGRAHCEPAPGHCTPGAERCTSDASMQFCDADGNWSTESDCKSCSTASGLGVTCPGALPASAVATVTATVQYEMHGNNADRTDWDPQVTLAPSQEAVMVSFIADPKDATQTIAIDAALTDFNGAVSLKVPSKPGPNDVVVAFAMHTTPDGPVFAIARPDFKDGQVSADDPLPDTGNNTIWSKSWATSSLSNNAQLTITEADGSGAFRMFDIIRWARERAIIGGGDSKQTLLVLMRPNTDYDCGTCFVNTPIELNGNGYDTQIRYGSPAGDDAFWSDAVVAHEFGHSIMQAYGTMPAEGGLHTISCLDAPGMAWAEGWATGFSRLVMGDPVYTDKQGGTYFWFDISKHQYGDGSTWTEPTQRGGTFQLIDENFVSSVLWFLADHSSADNDPLSNTPAIMKALESAQMNGQTFGRGYLAQISNGTCDEMTLSPTGQPSPMLADYLDAMLCNHLVTPAAMQSAVGSYPYDVNHPICQ